MSALFLLIFSLCRPQISHFTEILIDCNYLSLCPTQGVMPVKSYTADSTFICRTWSHIWYNSINTLNPKTTSNCTLMKLSYIHNLVSMNTHDVMYPWMYSLAKSAYLNWPVLTQSMTTSLNEILSRSPFVNLEIA